MKWIDATIGNPKKSGQYLVIAASLNSENLLVNTVHLLRYIRENDYWLGVPQYQKIKYWMKIPKLPDTTDIIPSSSPTSAPPCNPNT